MPSIFNTARILSTLGSGLLIGPIIGAGIFASELIASRLEIIKKAPRLLFGSIVATIFIGLGFVGFHTLFLDNPPSGILIVIASFLIALGGSLGVGITQSKIARFAIGVFFAALALYGSGALSIGTEQAPLLYYDFREPVTTASRIAFTSIFFGLTNVAYRQLKPEEEQV